MFRTSEYVDKPPEHQPETPLRVLWRKIRDWWLFSDDELQFRDQIHHELPVRPQRLPEGLTPAAQLRVTRPQERTDQTLKRLRQRRIRDVALVLVELARREQAARRHQHFVQLVDDRGLATPGRAGHQHQLRRAARDDALKGG